MSTRGIKFVHSVGDFVLCFEPDPSKARVLYDAKILDTTTSRDLSGLRVPAYHVHFQGWNNSWDRIVPECFILKNTEEFRELMKKLADTTKKYRINSARNKRIDRILRKAFRGRPPIFDYDEDSPYEDDDSISSDSEIDVKESEGDLAFRDQLEDDPSNSKQNGRIQDSDTEKNINVDIELPLPLKEELEKDYIAVNNQNMLLTLPAKPNIISILEEFVKSFCVNILFSTSSKTSLPNKDGSHVPVERNIPLCKELVDGLRICFDYTLPLILLYGSERAQLENITTNFKPSQETQKSAKPQIVKKSPAKRKHGLKACQPVANNGDMSPKIPKLSPEIFKDKLEFYSTEQEEIAPRRLTRKSVLDNAKKHAEQKSSSVELLSSSEDNDKDENKAEFGRKRETRSRKYSSVKSEPLIDSTDTSQTTEDAPPPLLIPNTRQTDRPESKASSNSGGTPSESYKEDLLDRILSWQLLPPEKLQSTPTAPSLIYGAQHLLRLFVKIPDLIKSMNMEEHKIKALICLLHCFLDYLMERREELFQESLYLPHDEEFSGVG